MARFGQLTLNKFEKHVRDGTLDQFPDPFIQPDSGKHRARRDQLRHVTCQVLRREGEIPVSYNTLEALGFVATAS